jgi:hypothetical protein
MRSAVFWDVTQRIVLIPSDGSGQQFEPILKSTLRHIAEERRSQETFCLGKAIGT